MSKKKLISIILAFVLIITVLPAMARAEDVVVEPAPMTDTMEQPVVEVAAEQAVNEEPAAVQEDPEVTSQAVVPGNVSGLTAAARTDGSVKLTWNKAANAYKYLIYRSTTKSGGYKVIRKQRASSYADTAATGLKPSTRYYYKVVPYTQDNVRGRSSSPVTAVTKVAVNATFQLKIYQGFDFNKKVVIDYDNEPDLVDMHFFYHYRVPGGLYVYLGADRIREFDAPPTGLTAAQVDEWEDWICPPEGDKYYVIRARDGRHYLLHLLKYENQGMAATYWLMTFDWKEITVS